MVNDSAERGVKLIQEYNKIITNNEEEKQYLLQIVEDNRKSIKSNATKEHIFSHVST